MLFFALAHQVGVISERKASQTFIRSSSPGGMEYWRADNGTMPSDRYEATPLDIEITAYVLLSLMKRHSPADIAKGSKIVRWLTLQRNSYGGFKSTQVQFCIFA